MRFSLDWLAQYVELPASAEELAERLTFAGHAVEGLEKSADDTLLDVEITTNRPDCMNHLGLAREIAVLYDRPLMRRLSEPRTADERTETAAAVAVEVPEDCPRYAAVVVRGVRVGPGPDWLARRLEAVGVRPINNVVDITNFVLWETGQPLHAFDLATLAESRIVVRRALAGETLVTLDGERRELDPEILVIADPERAVALAGIMGGRDTEVTGTTVDVLLESAHFDPVRVRLGARRLGLATDASHRFERGTDPEACLDAALRAAALIAELAGGEVLAEPLDVRAPSPAERSGELDLERLVAFAGVDVAAADAERWLAGLGFRPEPLAPGRWRVRVPSWRRLDFEPDGRGRVAPADLYEEVLRVFGFDRIPAALPALGDPDAGSSAEHERRERVRDRVAACGFAEAITFAFHEAAADGHFAGLAREGEALTLANPLSEQYAVMRRSLLPNLLAAARFNVRRGAEAVRLFEIGALFPGGRAAEIEALALVAGGRAGIPWDRQGDFDLFDLKGVVESLAADFGTRLEARAAALPGLLEGTASELVEGGGRTVGYLGQVDDPELPFPFYAAELAVGVLESEPGGLAVRLPSRFPSIAADFTLTHDLETSWAEIERAILEAEVPDLREIGLKDRYRGAGVPEGAVNTTVYFLYNSEERSLTQEEVNERQQALAETLRRRFGRD